MMLSSWMYKHKKSIFFCQFSHITRTIFIYHLLIVHHTTPNTNITTIDGLLISSFVFSASNWTHTHYLVTFVFSNFQTENYPITIKLMAIERILNAQEQCALARPLSATFYASENIIIVCVVNVCKVNICSSHQNYHDSDSFSFVSTTMCFLW